MIVKAVTYEGTDPSNRFSGHHAKEAAPIFFFDVTTAKFARKRPRAYDMAGLPCIS